MVVDRTRKSCCDIVLTSGKCLHNEFKLKKGFRECFNTTVFGYLREKRMERAGELLQQNKSSVIEVANAVHIGAGQRSGSDAQ